MSVLVPISGFQPAERILYISQTTLSDTKDLNRAVRYPHVMSPTDSYSLPFNKVDALTKRRNTTQD